jgi:hypothetical protein
LSAPGVPTVEVPLVAQEGVDRLGYSGRLGAAISYLIFGAKR